MTSHAPATAGGNRRRVLAAVGLPLLITAAMTLYLLSIRTDLPDDVATHWNADGVADGFTSRNAFPWLAAGLTAVSGMPIAIISLLAPRSPVTPKLLGGLGAGIGTFVSAVFVLTARQQIDVIEPPSFDGSTLAISGVAALIVSALAGLISGNPPTPPRTSAPAPADANRIPLPDGATAVWSGRTPLGTAMIVATAATTILFLVISALTTWWMLLILAAIAALLIASTSFDVTAGPTGLRVAGAFGFPRVKIPLDQITSAEVDTVRAMQFGGWGLRVGLNGDSAVLTKSGPALAVTRTDGARFFVSLDEPADAAAVISTLLDRRA